jgi:Xaa-Pro aminopeptidase
MFKSRRARLERFFKEFKVDAILFSNLLNIRYLSGFTGSEGVLLATPDACWLLCDSRYTTQARLEVVDTEVIQFSEKKNSVASLLEEQHLTQVGFESAHTTVSAFKEFSACLQQCELVAINETLDQIRSVKDSGEIEQLSIVARLASESLLSVLDLIKPGVSEKTIARELEIEMIRRGAEGRSFDFIVASGERGSMPHGRASDKLISSDELVTIDFGAVLNGFNSDETVTVAVGRPEDRLCRIYSVVKEAHDLAIAAVKPGIACCELDRIAREHIKSSGYGEYFGHGLGHGLGLEIHEKPVISPRTNLLVEAGMVFTIEPGIYIPGLGGVRIEDTLAVTEQGCRLLTQMSKDLIYL